MPPCSPVPVIARSAARLFGADYSRISKFESHLGQGVFVCSESETVSNCTGDAT